MSDLDDFNILSASDTLTGDRQNALARLLARLLTEPANGRPFIMSPGELRRAIRLAEEQAGTSEVLNYEHPLLPDPVVSCASKDQLMQNLKRRFGYCPDCESGRCTTHCAGCQMGPGCPDHG